METWQRISLGGTEGGWVEGRGPGESWPCAGRIKLHLLSSRGQLLCPMLAALFQSLNNVTGKQVISHPPGGFQEPA